MAETLCDDFADGARFVALAAAHDSATVLAAIAHELGIRDNAGSPLASRIAQNLLDKHLLLLLDNFEQVLAAASSIADLLAHTACVTVVVTSRVPLRISGEHEYRVQPLAVLELQRQLSLEALAQNPAVALFMARASAVRQTLSLTAENDTERARLYHEAHLQIVRELGDSEEIALHEPARTPLAFVQRQGDFVEKSAL